MWRQRLYGHGTALSVPIISLKACFWACIARLSHPRRSFTGEWLTTLDGRGFLEKKRPAFSTPPISDVGFDGVHGAAALFSIAPAAISVLQSGQTFVFHITRAHVVQCVQFPALLYHSRVCLFTVGGITDGGAGGASMGIRRPIRER